MNLTLFTYVIKFIKKQEEKDEKGRIAPALWRSVTGRFI